jgi:predicted CoA-substrate-specific enzyme activase
VETYNVGVDAGSITTKVAVMARDRIVGYRLAPSGFQPEEVARRLLASILAAEGSANGQVGKILATGYGRQNISLADKKVTEITCHAAGAHFLSPQVRFIIDIGGQDSKVISLDPSGKVLDFLMNDKCAAGTGRFLEVMARALEIPLNEMATLAAAAVRPAEISSICTVFAESEVISLIAAGEKRENIVAGINEAVARRVAALAKRLGVMPPAMMTGGVALNAALAQSLSRQLGVALEVSLLCQLTGAIGAALLAGRLPQ